MITIHGQSTAWFDCDNTLIKWQATPEEKEKYGVEFTYTSGVVDKLVPHIKHIAQLKEHHTRHTSIVVWSAAGAAWAETVVKTLGLEQYVDVCIGKPNWVYDDLAIEKFMPKARWLDDPNFKIEDY